MPTRLPILCVDFDGVLHSYTSGWKGSDVILDPPVDGAVMWLESAVQFFDVCIYSSRSKSEMGIKAMIAWLHKYGIKESVLAVIRFPKGKPAAFLTIDDRAVCFNGKFPAPEELVYFQPWNKRKK